MKSTKESARSEIELQIEMKPLARLGRDPWQKRRLPTNASVEELASSIGKWGIKLPLQVRPDGKEGWFVMDGERRRLAALLAGLEFVPCQIHYGDFDEARVTSFAVLCNIHREQLGPLEFAAVCESQMRVNGWTAVELSSYMSIDASSVSRALPLLSLPDAIKAMIEAGTVLPSLAYELSKIPDEATQLALAARVAAGEMTRDAVAGARRRASRKDAASAPVAKRVTAKLPGKQSVTVQGEIESIDGFIATIEDVLARARTARKQGLSVQTFCKAMADTAKTG